MKTPDIITLCPFGLGTSLLLSMTVKDVLKEGGIPDKGVRATSMGEALAMNPDLYVITSDLVNFFEKKGKKNYVAVKNVFDKENMKKVLAPYIEKWKKQ